MKNSFGVIDIGSNSVRMVIYDVGVHPPVQTFNEKVYCALGRDLTRTGKLNPEGATAALEGLRRYADLVKEHFLTHLDVVGTAALRDATDGPDFIATVRAETGLEIRLISGSEEARYAALGVFSLDPVACGIVADFGGGSLEFGRIANGEISATVSKPYGAFRALAMGDDAAHQIGNGLAELVAVYGDAPALYAIGGSWRALAQAYMKESGHGDAALQGYKIPRAETISFCETIAALTPDQIMQRYGMDDKKATLAPVSAFVLVQVMKILRPQALIVSMAGIRDGIVYDFNKR